MKSPALTNLLNQAYGLTRQQAEDLEFAFDAYADRNLRALSNRVDRALASAGAFENRDSGSASHQIMQIDSIVDHRRGGGAAAARAVLARELGIIEPADFERLTRWWPGIK